MQRPISVVAAIREWIKLNDRRLMANNVVMHSLLNFRLSRVGDFFPSGWITESVMKIKFGRGSRAGA